MPSIPQTKPTDAGPIGKPPTPDHVWGYFPELRMYGWRLKPAAERVVGGDVPTGVIPEKVHRESKYWTPYHGEITRAAVYGLLATADGITDDSAKWHFAIVGDDAFFAKVQADIKALGVADKLLVQCYKPDNWAVDFFKLSRGITLRRPSPGRESETVGTLTVENYSPDKLAELLQAEGGPLPKPKPIPLPMPSPAPQPAPDQPLPTPAVPPGIPGWLVLLIVGGALYIFRNRLKGQ